MDLPRDSSEIKIALSCHACSGNGGIGTRRAVTGFASSGGGFTACTTCHGTGWIHKTPDKLSEIERARILAKLGIPSGLLESLPRTADGHPITIGSTVFVPNPDASFFGQQDTLEMKVDSIGVGVTFPEYEGTMTIAGYLVENEQEALEVGNMECFAKRPPATPHPDHEPRSA